MRPRNELAFPRLAQPTVIGRPKTRVAVGLILVSAWLLALTLFSVALTFPQDAPRSRRDRQTAKSDPNREKEGERSSLDKSGKNDATFGVDVNLVVMNTTVLDRKTGKFVEGLRKEDFVIFEDRVEQQLISFNQEDVPITMGLLIDTSGSMRHKIDPVIKAGLKFVQASNPQDEEFVISFNSEATLVEDFTGDINDLRDSLDNLIVGGGTALYDAIYLGVKKAQQGHKPKRVAIVITDGEDRDSQYKFEDVLEKIREADVQVYAIGFIDPEEQRGLFEGVFKKSRQRKAHDVLEKVAEETGGKAIFPKDILEIDEVVKNIAHELRNQYSLGYVSSNQVKNGSWRAVRVSFKRPDAGNKYRIITRSGYYAPKK